MVEIQSRGSGSGSRSRSSGRVKNLRVVSDQKPVKRTKRSFADLIGRNRMVMLNIFKFVAFKRRALSLIGGLNKRYAHFVKQDIAMFEILEKEKRLNYVGNDQEYSEFLQECANSNQDFSIELYIRVRYLQRFLSQCA